MGFNKAFAYTFVIHVSFVQNNAILNKCEISVAVWLLSIAILVEVLFVNLIIGITGIIV